MIIIVGVGITLIISFLWALFSLQKELKRVRGGERRAGKDKIENEDREIVLFDRTSSR